MKKTSEKGEKRKKTFQKSLGSHMKLHLKKKNHHEEINIYHIIPNYNEFLFNN